MVAAHAWLWHERVTPKDAATLILIDSRADGPRILMGRRHASHAFLPGKYVFPGGRREAADARMAHVGELPPVCAEKLALRCRGGAGRARALALAAIRETFEETGFILGRPGRAPGRVPDLWGPFAATGHLPDLAPLTFIGRAITPPGRPRRFDARFFLCPAGAIANPGEPIRHDGNELLETAWLTLPEALALDLPHVTRQMLTRLDSARFGPKSGDPVPFDRQIRGKWLAEWL